MSTALRIFFRKWSGDKSIFPVFFFGISRIFWELHYNTKIKIFRNFRSTWRSGGNLMLKELQNTGNLMLLKELQNTNAYGIFYHYHMLLNKFAKLSKARRDHWSLIIEDHKSLMNVWPPQKKFKLKKFKVKKFQSWEISMSGKV